MEHELLKLNSHCNCELEFDEIVEAVVLVYKDSVDIYYQHTKDEIAVSVLPGKKCLAMLSTTADYLLLKKKGKKLIFKQGYTYSGSPCYETIKIILKNNDVVVKRKKDKKEERIRMYDRLDEMFDRISEDYDSGQEEEDDDPIAVLGDLEINMEGDTSDE
ncbi:hypothetical protein [uncultured Phascolarctobacterium sp.]|uniref:hypothetical protein n=1 Tax=uncultured Phascolarctobacterium sp. TaxID=512296 RepID=UPI0027DD9D3C|nr:hypothetical protein [uncultured Phascolarctobacterium sp.]